VCAASVPLAIPIPVPVPLTIPTPARPPTTAPVVVPTPPPVTSAPVTQTLSPIATLAPVDPSPVTPAPVEAPTVSPATSSPLTPSPVDVATISPATSLPESNITFRAIIDSDPDFSTLGQALDAAAFDIENFDFLATLFAPNNGAFAKLNQTLLNTLLSPGFTSHLANVLSTHVVEGALPSLVDGNLSAVNGEVLTVSVGDTNNLLSSGTENARVTLLSVGDTINISSSGTENAVVTLPEIVSADGIFYEVNDVLLPSFASSSVLDVVMTSENLSILSEFLMLTGLDQLFASVRMATLFAPNDDALRALGTKGLDYYRSNVDVAETLLSGHLVLDEVVFTAAVNAGPVVLQSEAGDTLTFMSDFRDDGTPIYTVNNVEIVMSDVFANNGIIQVINSVLSVPGADLPEFPSDSTSSFPSASPAVGAPSASPTSEWNAEGMGMMKNDMVKSKKIEKAGKSSKKSKKKKGSGKEKGTGNSGKGKRSDGSTGKGKRSKTCDDSKDPK
jgi:uncharacterized surface protein with fasciclin (FAS1) repeats